MSLFAALRAAKKTQPSVHIDECPPFSFRQRISGNGPAVSPRSPGATYAGESKKSQALGLSYDRNRPPGQLWTSHRLSSAFLALEAGVEQRAVFEHGAGDVEETVADGAESAGMAAAAGFQSKILGFALLVAAPGGVR